MRPSVVSPGPHGPKSGLSMPFSPMHVGTSKTNIVATTRCIPAHPPGSVPNSGALFVRKLSGFLAAFSLCGALFVGTRVDASNPITIENANAGTPASQWDISGAGDLSIQGFATDISVNKGGTIHFKISTNATAYRLDIYRLGYYAGMGARFMATVLPSATLPQNQPNPITDDATGLIDCGNWAESASWAVPATATSGLYIAKVTRTDTGGASHIPFVVRDDASTSEVFFQTSDTTWQAYNSYGGNSLYVGNPAGRAYKVSYNRPFITRANDTNHDWIFNAEYPMIRWLESNGYNVSYTTGMDSDRRGNLILQHKIFLSVGHDEYWSGTQRTNVEAARAGGVNLAFFSGNEIFWKTRWENSIDGSNTTYRTLVCYKETHAGARIDPLDTGAANSVWTGTWRDPRFSPPADGGRPENSLSGTIFMVNGPANDSITVPASYGAHRFWRNTGVDTQAPGASATMPAGTLGYEWDEAPNNGSQPVGLMRLSLVTLPGESYLQDYGSTYATATATHSLTLYRHSSGALVFGAGSIQWAWGMDSNHDGGNLAASHAMQQATVNLFADMKVQPASLQSGLVAASASTDLTPPTSVVQSPASGSSVTLGSQVTITGIASDAGGGKVWGVEVSVDGGTTWNAATGTANWSYALVPWQTGPVSIKTRAFDDSGNIETPSAGITLNVSGSSSSSQHTIWPNTSLPNLADAGADAPAELGVKFHSDVAGTIIGIRFYKSAANTGTHIGNLWTASGTLLASATFSGETASGWQQVNFATPVAVTPNTEYVASYHLLNGHYSDDLNYFSTHGLDNAPLHAQTSTVSDPNGVFAYGASSTFPNQTWSDSNYWVDVVLQTGATPVSIAVAPVNASLAAGSTLQYTATGTYSDNSTQNITSQVTWSSSSPSHATISTSGLASGVAPGNTTISATLNGVSGSQTLTVAVGPLVVTTASLGAGSIGSAYSATLAATGGSLPYTWALTVGALPNGLALNGATGAITGTPTTAGTFSFTVQATDSGASESSKQTATKALSIVVTATAPNVSVWPATATPVLADGGPDNSVELGVKFRSDVAGTIKSIRFYKAATNTGTHTGTLWTSTGTQLATATFTGETASGWQQVNFSSPVAIAANTVYVASYHAPSGHYSADLNYFLTAGIDNAPLHALANGVSGPNGVYSYGAASIFPNQTWNSTNYWVDVVFQASAPPTLVSIAVTPAGSSILTTTTQQFTATGTYSDSTTQNLTSQVTWTSSATGVATINAAGLASAVAPGSTTISAKLGSITGSTSLAVTVPPLSVTTATLINGTAGTAYNATLAATGGTGAYSWTVSAGALPAGLTLTGAGVLAGTPTAAGTSNFTVKVTDSGSPAQNATKALSLTITTTLTSIAVTPANPTIVVGATQQFTATGTYSDATTQNLTSQVTWTSSVTTKATINASGLATGVASGSTTITAKFNTVTGTTGLNVQPPPLVITTTSLAGGTAGTAYSATLAASGGTTPYAWSITGSLPAGLTLNGTTGVISGTPTATGTFNFTAVVSDASSPLKTANSALTIVVAAAPTIFSIWPNTTVPALVDGGPDGAVELGVKIRMDVAGTITGIRFYKAAANTGTHIGNLWSSTGTLLGSVTFTGETASGWQQVNFATPITVTANTVYVASYHVNTGHYSADLNYFTTAGHDNAPLHALANGVSGSNGVYSYTSASAFPTQTWNATNYWVDVLFKPSASLTSIAVTPANPSIQAGATQQFTATGTYSDSTTQNLTSQVTWASSATARATIGGTGLANALTAGTTTISATLAGITGSTQLTVQPQPLAIGTTSLASGMVATSYSAALSASGGTAPYAWSITTGALPTGLTLNPGTGQISGTPSVSGVFAFTVQATDSATPAQAATKPLSLTITAALASISVTPANPTVVAGATQQFAATGVFTDSSTTDLTNQVTWASSATARATISGTGLATAVTGGPTTISATKGAIVGSTTLTVQPATLTIGTASVPAGTIGLAYSATLAGTGGTSPYSWSLASGALPPGLTLAAATGVISGTPTGAGTFSFTVKLTDSGSPAQNATKALTITTVAAPTVFTIWPNSAVPATVDGGPDNSVELGVRFRADVAGAIKGIRFYKAAANTGTHTGSLWSTSGTQLATATFTGETTSGWQQVTFSTPVAVTANTMYVASYHAPSGHYSADTGYFASTGVDNSPLHAPANGVSGANGIFAYGSNSTFPSLTWNSANYWVDVLFSPQGSGGSGDTTPPTVVSVSPAKGVGGAALSQAVTLTFSEALNPSSVTSSTMSLRDSANTLIPATVTYDNTSFTATLTPSALLNASTTYAVTAKGGAGGIADVAGNPLVSDFVSSFATLTYGAAGNGPGGPILIVSDSAHPFGKYLAEILLAEGLNSFQMADLSTISTTSLAPFDVVLLGETSLNSSQVSILTNWVNGGGNLIAMRPDKQLAGLLGLSDAGATLSEGYLQVNTTNGPGTGIVGTTIQFHNTADRYATNGATVLATLFADASTPTSNPAVTVRSLGSNGGKAAAFTFDLAKSVVFTRQGNPAWIDQNRDGQSPPSRADDLFFGNAPFDPQPDWINLDKVQIPQADEQQHLLANMIISMNAARRPLPRFWIFPHGYKAAIVMTGDDHGTTYGGFAGTSGRFNIYSSYTPQGASVDDWTAIRSTSYMFPDPNGGPPTDQQAVAYDAAGFEIALHLNTNLTDYTSATLDTMLTNQLNQWKALFPSLPSPVTHRAHAIAWSGYTIMPSVELAHGIRLDTTYYYWPSTWVADRPGMFTGSGLPMRFASATGDAIDVYQAPTQMTDESGQTYSFTVDTLLDNATGPLGYYGAFVANMHTDFPDEPGSDEIILSAVSRGVPIISARQLLNWTDARNSSSFTGITWTGSTLGFNVAAAPAAHGLEAMVPIPVGSSVTAVRQNGSPIAAQLRVVKGVQYVVVPAQSASYQVDFTPDTTAPTVLSVSPTNGATGINPNTQVTVLFSEAMDPATVNGSTFTLRDSANNLVAANVSYNSLAFTATLIPGVPLSAQKSYTVSVAGGASGIKDLAGNPVATFSSAFTTGTPPVPVYSIWSNTDAPVSVTPSDASPIEVGVKIQSNSNGYITGLRFYKSPLNTGTHVGNLWSRTGTLLASVAFTNETEAGWQYQALPTPVAITAHTTYVASYHTSAGFYSSDNGFFTGQGEANGPLQALAAGVDGPNGVYAYGAGGFPDQDGDGANYWVDVTFQTTLGP